MRESLRVVRAYFGQTLLSLGGFIYLAIVLGGIGALVFLGMRAPTPPAASPSAAYEAQGTYDPRGECDLAVELCVTGADGRLYRDTPSECAPADEACWASQQAPYTDESGAAIEPAKATPPSTGTSAPPPWTLALWFLGLNLVALIAAALLSLFQYIHRRVVTTFQVIMTPLAILINLAAIAQSGVPLNTSVSAVFGRESPITMAILIVVVFGLMIASIVMVFGWARNCWRLLFARRANFLVARGWRAPRYTLGDAIRRMLGVPTYVSALQNGRRRVMAMYVLAGALGAGAALFPLTAPGLIASVLASGANSNPDGEPQRAFALLIGAPIFIVVFFLFLQLLAFFGRLANRKGQRMAAGRYQSVREWDDRAPILYLRSFTIDNQPVAVKPRGWTARLIGLGARFPTLDEAVLDSAAPYGPVIAIGDPRDPLPPLGAARTFVGGGDWQRVVADLARAAELIVLVVDSSEGVRWEVRHVIDNGLWDKTLFLASPSRTQAERSASLEEVARMLGYDNVLPARAIGVSPARHGGIEVLASPTTSGDAYATALNLRLQQDFGLRVEFPKRPRAA